LNWVIICIERITWSTVIGFNKLVTTDQTVKNEFRFALFA